MLKPSIAIAFTSVFAIVMISLLAGITINFKPFKIGFDRPLYAAGFVLIIIGFKMIEISAEKKGEKKAYQEFIDKIESKEWKIVDSTKKGVDPSKN